LKLKPAGKVKVALLSSKVFVPVGARRLVGCVVHPVVVPLKSIQLKVGPPDCAEVMAEMPPGEPVVGTLRLQVKALPPVLLMRRGLLVVLFTVTPWEMVVGDTTIFCTLGPGVTVSTKLKLTGLMPSVRVMVMVAVPLWKGTGVARRVRAVPLPPKVMEVSGRRVVFDEEALRKRPSAGVSVSAIVKARSPVFVFPVMV
jgi:hypothetical protein